jgi:16S rRNA U1498 N3-methylase RsmE
MADEGMSEDEAKALAAMVRRVTGHDVEVQAEEAYFVVEVRRAVPGDSFTLRDGQDWQWLGRRIRETE